MASSLGIVPRGTLLLLGLLLLSAVAASAQPVDMPPTWGGDIWSRPRLTGSWFGLRDDLGKKGVRFDVGLDHDDVIKNSPSGSGSGLRSVETGVVGGLRLYARF